MIKVSPKAEEKGKARDDNALTFTTRGCRGFPANPQLESISRSTPFMPLIKRNIKTRTRQEKLALHPKITRFPHVLQPSTEIIPSGKPSCSSLTSAPKPSTHHSSHGSNLLPVLMHTQGSPPVSEFRPRGLSSFGAKAIISTASKRFVKETGYV